MQRMAYLLLALALGACGTGKKKQSSDDGDPAVTTDADGNPINNSAGTADGVPVSGGQPGAPGNTGKPGIPGPAGPVGPAGGLMLFDANDHAIGVQLRDDEGSVAQVVLSDHRYVMIDRETGALFPHLNLSCLYETDDCTGMCFVYDKRWLNQVIADADGKTWVANRNAANEGAKQMASYVGEDAECVMNTIGTTESYAALPYALPAGLSLPFAAPLYWDTAH